MGKLQRSTGVVWVQTALQISQDESGKRKAQKLSATIVKDRTAHALQEIIVKSLWVNVHCMTLIIVVFAHA